MWLEGRRRTELACLLFYLYISRPAAANLRLYQASRRTRLRGMRIFCRHLSAYLVQMWYAGGASGCHVSSRGSHMDTQYTHTVLGVLKRSSGCARQAIPTHHTQPALRQLHQRAQFSSFIISYTPPTYSIAQSFFGFFPREILRLGLSVVACSSFFFLFSSTSSHGGGERVPEPVFSYMLLLPRRSLIASVAASPSTAAAAKQTDPFVGRGIVGGVEVCLRARRSEAREDVLQDVSVPDLLLCTADCV